MTGTDERASGGVRSLPSVSDILQDTEVAEAGQGIAPEYRTVIVRMVLAAARRRITAHGGDADRAEIIAAIRHDMRALTAPKLTPLINATGVILHTNLGRAPVSAETAAAMRDAAVASVPLEFDLETGGRGGRMAELARLLQVLTGCEAALVVNNNAAATMLLLAATVAPERNEVLVSRAEAVEIGGSFRIPDILRQSGATLVDVGTTNRTYVGDYTDAFSTHTAAILKVHTSNFRLSGFIHTVAASELVAPAEAHGVAVIDDLGSGALVDTTQFGLAAEPTLPGSVAGGAHLICASGDKLLGGPQAGIILGKKEWVARCAAHPLARAFRADKATLAGMAATLRHYLRNEHLTCVPVWRMIATDVPILHARCRAWEQELQRLGVPVAIEESRATVGGGSLPGETLPSFALTISAAEVRAAGTSLDGLAQALRRGSPAIIGRVEQGMLWLDARTIFPDDADTLIRGVASAWQAATA